MEILIKKLNKINEITLAMATKASSMLLLSLALVSTYPIIRF